MCGRRLRATGIAYEWTGGLAGPDLFGDRNCYIYGMGFMG